MKKNLLYLFTFVCCLGLFAACSDDDDDDPKTEPWKEISKTYEGDKLEVTGGAAGTVEVNAASEEAATIKLNNVVPEDKAVAIEGKLTKSGDQYTVTGETTVNNCTVSVNGKFTDGVLNVTVTRNLATAVTGEHDLQIITLPATTGMLSLVPVHFEAVTGDPTIDAMIEQANMGTVIGGLIASKVTAVNVKLPANGVFDVNWTTVDGKTVTLAEAAGVLAPLINITYAMIDNKFYLAMDKTLIDGLGVTDILEGMGLNAEDILKLLTDLGGYYGIPMEYKDINGDGIPYFMMNKDQLIPILGIVSPILAGIMPEGFEQLLPALQNAQQLELGLPFIKK